MAVAAGVVVLVGVFAAIAASVVHVRRPLDAQASRSFEATLPRLLNRVRVRPSGCTKRAVDVYFCSAEVRLPRHRSGVTVLWRMALADDGCWLAPLQQPIPPR